MFEPKHDRLLSRPAFLQRMVGVMFIVLGVIAVALSIGVLGYHYLARFTWVDSILNASMILGGMGPVGDLPNDGAKLFASAYAIFSGLVFISMMGIVLGPLAHRMLHRFHVDDSDIDDEQNKTQEKEVK